MTMPVRTLTLALHVMCVCGLVGGTLAGVVLRACMLRADDTARRVTVGLLRVLAIRVELAMLLGAFATGAVLLMQGGFPGGRLWLGAKLALVMLAAGLGHIDSLRIKRAATSKPDPATLAELLHPGWHQAALLVWLSVIALTVLHVS